mgnify:CR=1 FL=1
MQNDNKIKVIKEPEIHDKVHIGNMKFLVSNLLFEYLPITKIYQFNKQMNCQMILLF